VNNYRTIIQGGVAGGVEGGGYLNPNFGPFRISEQVVATTRSACEARDLRQEAKQRRKALRTVGAGVGATEGENWVPISRKRHQIGHLDLRSFQLLTEGFKKLSQITEPTTCNPSRHGWTVPSSEGKTWREFSQPVQGR
jgi:hypothetical protein